tara:strand:+ start:2644 stop:2802 length:159 start_codon:yes stop_codon:yes gene_type:complete
MNWTQEEIQRLLHHIDEVMYFLRDKRGDMSNYKELREHLDLAYDFIGRYLEW